MPSDDNQIDQEANNVAQAEANHNAVFKAVAFFLQLLKNYYPEGAFMEDTPPSSFTFVITYLFAFVAIKSQGNTKFPFDTHPQTVMLSVICVLMYGFSSAAQHFIFVAKLCPDSIYAIIARLGRIASLTILVASLVCLLSF